MGEGLNRVLLLGNLGADPELKMTQGGTAVLNIRMATNERYCDKSGVWQDKTEWHSVTVWGKRAEGLHKVLEKGSSIFVEGSLHTSSYEDRDGNKRYKTEVNAKSVLLCGGRGEGGGRHGSQESRREQPSPAARAPVNAPPPDDLPPVDDFPNDDDLPF